MTENIAAPLIPPLYQYGMLEAFQKTVRLLIAYGVLTGYIRVI
ncbi:hypothetical protein SEA_LEOPARD_57 [Mycobacterium phage Leopard]|uniref:Uncharacterized protein n=1 Tax=Mycobacterium phage Onyinye TaxID=2686235 RepID=A0A6B9L9H9_9CAUD|nr:hypothetical protein PP339_gp058 [Mycobacterium phage Onyinye]QHB37463.1 hypothetical protein SEA_ONYINYE_58 [Mycobacterium phage Onyinye]UOW92934.1 hypothetical protein SEA_LEOPARD_57 [Mycobacterium phage Leopard]WKW85220.1 hypothetical protein SEA_AIKOY__58 [Mycobacterium phage Aikoy]